MVSGPFPPVAQSRSPDVSTLRSKQGFLKNVVDFAYPFNYLIQFQIQYLFLDLFQDLRGHKTSQHAQLHRYSVPVIRVFE